MLLPGPHCLHFSGSQRQLKPPVMRRQLLLGDRLDALQWLGGTLILGGSLLPEVRRELARPGPLAGRGV